ncbi:hypothetical protein Ae201684P_001891 [Aphanomyces euteiches]|nr:hypothetical protein Ae201684P_001891 [Aphanomyces euteiches]
MQRSLSRANSHHRISVTSNAGQGLATYSKLSVSMTYRNRQSTVYDESNNSFLRESNLEDKSRMTNESTASVASTYCSSRDSSPSYVQPRTLERQASTVNSPINTIREDSDVSDVEIAAMQAKRALRRMCLSLVTLNQQSDEIDDDDEDDDEDEGVSSVGLKFPLESSDEDDEDESFVAPVKTRAKPRLDSDLITISRADLRQFQSRLKMLEDKLAAQADAQADLEENIEREVRARTKKIEEQYEEKIEELTMARDLEVDQEIQRRLSEFSASSSSVDSKAKTPGHKKGLFRGKSSVTDLFRGSNVSDLDQFKEFLMNNSKRMSDRLSRSTQMDIFNLREEGDGHGSSELVDTVQRLRHVVHDQDEQLEQAKYLISVAVVKMNVTEEVVNDAFEEMGKMDARLERQAQEIAELRRQSSTYSSVSFNSSVSLQQPPVQRASGRYR